jgi:RNA polymerase sigma-70 factor (ECF subfamily)
LEARIGHNNNGLRAAGKDDPEPEASIQIAEQKTRHIHPKNNCRMSEPSSNKSDSELAAAIKLSDSAAFKLFYLRYAEALFSFVLAKVKHRAEAEDIVQTAFMRIWNDRAKLDTMKSLKSYLYAIANNLSIDFFRKKLPESFDMATLNPAIFPQSESDLKEVEDTIISAIKRLPAGPRKVFCLSRFNDLKYEEIAEILDLSIKTVENHMGRALLLLRSSLKNILPVILLTINLH